jgi:hypothetical protein
VCSGLARARAALQWRFAAELRDQIRRTLQAMRPMSAPMVGPVRPYLVSELAPPAQEASPTNARGGSFLLITPTRLAGAGQIEGGAMVRGNHARIGRDRQSIKTSGVAAAVFATPQFGAGSRLGGIRLRRRLCRRSPAADHRPNTASLRHCRRHPSLAGRSKAGDREADWRHKPLPSTPTRWRSTAVSLILLTTSRE